MDTENNNDNTKEFREDSYKNLLNKYGTGQDNSTAYEWDAESFVADLELTKLYEGNGLFTKIIDRPAEESIKHGLDIDFGNEEVSEYVEERLDDLDFEEKFATAEKWARLYGGSIIVMVVDDGRGLEEPLDYRRFTRIIDLRVYERAIVQADIRNIGAFNFEDITSKKSIYDEPEFYTVSSFGGQFRVHRSRCLVFKNGRVPEQTTNSLYRYWGIPEYVKIRRALRECITTHEYGTKMLERSVQAIYKMKNLANLLATDDGENKVLQRLQVIDMARGILNSIAIDNEGEDYNFVSGSMAGVNEIINSTCNMLSAVTDIPQTILFGRSPSGMNATGESDFENYYNMVENIQKQNMKKNVRTLLKLVIRQGFLDNELDDEYPFKVKFAALWSPTEAEKIQNESTKVSIAKTKADTANVYIGAGVLDPTEVRKALAKEGDFEIDEILEDDEFNIPDDAFDIGGVSSTLSNSIAASVQGVMQGNLQGTDSNASISTEIVDTISKNLAEVSEEESNTDEETLAEIVERAVDDISGRKDQDSTGDIAETIVGEITKRVNADGDSNQGVGVIVIKDGKILVGDRTDLEGICGPGGHVEDGEHPYGAAYRETAEEFKIIPKQLYPLEGIGATSGCLPSMIYLCTDYEGDPMADGTEMQNARWMSIPELKSEELFPAFGESLNVLAKLLTGVEVSDSMQTDGAPYGNTNASKDHVNPTGANKFTKGFDDANLENHWNGGYSKSGRYIHGHKDEYPGMTKEQYAARALELAEMPVGGDIQGFANTDGQIFRYDKAKNDLVIGHPSVGVATMYKPKDGIEHYLYLEKKFNGN